jgi:D-aminoacyl-tRNA deacylase
VVYVPIVVKIAVMRAVIQRVSESSVKINNNVTGRIGQGLLVLLGIEESDSFEDIEWLSGKIIRLRIFNDEEGVMNFSVKEIDGEILVISQFTLHASTKKGNRPSYIKAARPEMAIPLYNQFLDQLTKNLEKTVQSGIFGAMMEISLVNDGPVTIVMDSKRKE